MGDDRRHTNIEDGRVAGNNVYYDQLASARQIGMLPAKGSLADAPQAVQAYELTTSAHMCRMALRVRPERFRDVPAKMIRFANPS